MIIASDVPEIMFECERLKLEGTQVVKIDEAIHSDIFLSQLLKL